MEKKQIWKPGNMLYPVPVVMVSCGNREGKKNIITIAWAGTVCSDPAMVSISVRPERYSYDMIRDTKEFVINLTTEEIARRYTPQIASRLRGSYKRVPFVGEDIRILKNGGTAL